MAQVDKSFRPLSGSKVSEHQWRGFEISRDTVSVPSRGLRYLNILGMGTTEHHVRSFRPLVGSKVSEPLDKDGNERHHLGFRPLAGIKVSERSMRAERSRLMVVSVPSRGLRYLSFLFNNKMVKKQGFRPLTGIKVSERSRLVYNEVFDTLFPSPHGD